MSTNTLLNGIRQLHLYIGPKADKTEQAQEKNIEKEKTAPVEQNKVSQDQQDNAQASQATALSSQISDLRNNKNMQQQDIKQQLDIKNTAPPIKPNKLIGLRRNFLTLIKRRESLDIIKLLAILILFHLSLNGHINQFLTYIFHDNIHAFNTKYLNQASSDSIRTLEVVAGIKSILALLQSLSGGFSFIVDVEVQLGQSLTVLSNITDKAWAISLSAVGATETLSMLHSSIYFAMKPLLVALFFLLGLSIGLKKLLPAFSLKLEKFITLGLFLVVFSHIAVPISIYTTAKISQHYLKPQKDIIHQKLAEFSQKLPQHPHHSELKKQVRELRKHFKKGLHHHTKKTGDYSLLAVKHILYSAVEFILLPILILYALSKLLIIIIRKEIPEFHIK